MNADGSCAGRVVIVGASHAGVGVADALRRSGHAGEIVMISAERHLPYQRPLLSKSADLLQLPVERLSLRQTSFFLQNSIDLRLSEPVTQVDCAMRALTRGGGEIISFDHLVLAIGASARRLPEPRTSGRAPLYLRSLDDARRIHERISNGRRIAVIGGGLIGLEVAGLARSVGAEVVVYEAGMRLLGRVAPPEVAALIRARHTTAGIVFHLGVTIEDVAGLDRDYRVSVAGKEPEKFDTVLVAIGSVPEERLPASMGLRMANGIAVDEQGRTSAPNVWAVGDCADWGARVGAGTRYEGIQPATEQARIVAQAICGRDPLRLPLARYWSHQGALRLQTAGAMVEGAVLQPLPAEADGMCLLALDAGHPVACFAVDAPKAYREAVSAIEAARLKSPDQQFVKIAASA